MKKILRVNLNDQSYRFDDVKDEYTGLGGRGLGAAIICDDVSPGADALGEENHLIFVPGVLAGTSVPNSGRLSVCAKSPLTGTIKEANSGGEAGHKLARLGINALVVEGRADNLTTLKINKDGVEFLTAESLKGIGNYQLVETYKEQYGKAVSIISIGAGGELKLKAAGISVTSPDFHIRMAARGGLGAVMGSKNLKAVVVDSSGTKTVKAKDKERFKAAVKTFARGVAEFPVTGALKAFGTPVMLGIMSDAMGCLAVKNYSLGKFDNAAAISGEGLVNLINSRPGSNPEHKCMSGCLIHCSNLLTDEKGELIVSGLEFETLALVGSNCMIDDMDIIAQINRICNDVGVDTIDVGGAIGVAMENGLLEWGDGPGALEMVKGIEKGTANGMMIGHGVKHTGDTVGAERIPHVKGQCLSAYDPRGLKGTGVTYATTPMGADHTCGLILPDPSRPDYNHLGAEGHAPLSKHAQNMNAAMDTLGLCIFAGNALAVPENAESLITCVSALLDVPVGDDYFLKLGARVNALEVNFNRDAGFTKEDDRLPDFFTTEPLPSTGTVFDVPEDELDSIYGG